MPGSIRPRHKIVQNHDRLTFWVTIIVVSTLSSILMSVTAAFVVGLFLPNDVIDNKDILAIIGPAFASIVGGFIGLVTGIKLGSKNPEQPNAT